MLYSKFEGSAFVNFIIYFSLRKLYVDVTHLQETKEILLSKLDVGSSSSQALEAREVMENLRSDSTRSSGAKSKEDLVSILEKKTEALLQKDILLQNALEESSQLERQVTL